MEVNSLQVQELHKKFEELNEEISQALRVQEDALAATSSGVNGTGSAPRKDVLRLAKRAIDWREDVTALAKHIDNQLQHSRALRSQEAQVLLGSSADNSTAPDEDDGARLRCLRSDLRLLQDFRLAYVQDQDDTDPVQIDELEAETKQLRDLVDRSVKKEKSLAGQKDPAAHAVLALQLFETRRELMGKITEDILKDKKQLDSEYGIADLTSRGTGRRTESGEGKDVLASWDTQLYIKLVQALLDLQRDVKERFSSGRGGSNRDVPPSTGHQRDMTTRSRDVDMIMPTMSTTPGVLHRDDHGPVSSMHPTTAAARNATTMLEEVNFTLQKVRRELADLKSAHAKLQLAHSQLDDDLVQLQRKYDDEKRAHVNEKKWYVPKIQKLEETVMTTAKAFEELKLNVELITNMYKTLSQTLSTYEEEENELKQERDQIASLLASEIKKVAMLTKENTRQERLGRIAMAARHEMCELAKTCEQRMLVLEKSKLAFEQKAKEQEDELNVMRLQLEGAYSRLEATDEALGAAKATIERLQNEMDVCVTAAQAKENELKATFEKDQSALQQKFDKAKRELMDAMSQNLSLDGRLRKMQDKLNRLGGGASVSGT